MADSPAWQPRAAPLTRRGFLGGMAASVSTVACAQTRAQPIRPEDHGARGDAVQDDGRAFAAAFAAAAAAGRPIELRAGARYALGAPGWQGLRSASGLTIAGNGAAILIRAVPQQTLRAGIGRPAIRVDGGAVTVTDTQFDLGGLEVAALALDSCDIRIEGCAFANGHLSNRSFGTYLTRCRGLIRNNTGRELGHLFYVGHTDTGMGSHALRIAGNRAQALNADFVIGVLRDSVIEDNECDGMFGGVGLAALAQTGAFSENVLVARNRFSGFRAHGMQTDVWGEIRNRNILVKDNVMRRGARTSSGIYLVRLDGFEASGNRIEECDLGIVVDAAQDGLLQSNQIFAGGGEGRIRAIGMVAANGDIRRIRILDNQGQGFHDGIMLEGQRGTVSDVEIRGNSFSAGLYGIRSTVGLAGVTVRDNSFRANRRRDIETGPGVSIGANRHEGAG